MMEGFVGILVVVLVLPYSLHAYALWRSRIKPVGDVVVVPGCRVYSDGSLSPAFERRVRAAVMAMRQSGADRLLITGGHSGGPVSEGAAGASFAVTLGVPRSAILVEDAARNTRENACYTADILGEEPVIIVSDAYHLLRCRVAFGRYFEHITLVPTGLGRPRWRAGYRELFAILVMWRKMRIRLL